MSLSNATITETEALTQKIKGNLKILQKIHFTSPNNLWESISHLI